MINAPSSTRVIAYIAFLTGNPLLPAADGPSLSKPRPVYQEVLGM
jgi:hypothetical protein